MRQGFFGLFIFSFLVTASAVAPSNFRVIQAKKKVSIEIDGQFPPGASTDILFVVDDSGSMGVHQKNVSVHIQSFVDQALQTNNSFHIGVTNTFFEGPGGGAKGKVGELLGVPKVITPNTPNFKKVLRKNLMLGERGAPVESLFRPVVEALSEPNLSTLNKGFYRKNATLAIIFLTDTEDQSYMPAWEFANFLVDLKGGADNVILQSIMVSSKDLASGACKGEQYPPTKIEEALRLLQGDQYSLCSTQMAQDIKVLSKKVFPEPKGPYAPGVLIDEVTLVGTPEVSTIQVKFGTQVLPNDPKTGWVFDSAKNRIIFGQEIKWVKHPKETKIVVSYEAL